MGRGCCLGKEALKEVDHAAGIASRYRLVKEPLSDLAHPRAAIPANADPDRSPANSAPLARAPDRDCVSSLARAAPTSQRAGDGVVRQVMAAGVVQLKPKTLLERQDCTLVT